MRQVILVLGIIILLSEIATAQSYRALPSQQELPERFNIVGFWPSIKDPKAMTTFEVEACGKTFSFTFYNRIIHKRPKYVAKLIDDKLAELCGWEKLEDNGED